LKKLNRPSKLTWERIELETLRRTYPKVSSNYHQVNSSELNYNFFFLNGNYNILNTQINNKHQHISLAQSHTSTYWDTKFLRLWISVSRGATSCLPKSPVIVNQRTNGAPL